MDSAQLKKEQEKLKNVLNYLKNQTKELEEKIKTGLDKSSSDEYIKSHLKYIFSENLEKVKNAKEKPYFARVDFKENNTEGIENLYIGKNSIIDSVTGKSIIVDWRSQIANLYYEGRIGDAEYSCQVGKITGEIFLKRQFFISLGMLEKYIDIDVTTNDVMLQTALEGNADKRLKNIVSTIQEEQNRIIRAEMYKPLIVQGVAGSGKTTIALHRIAYLIYNYEKEFNPEEFLIIAPNKFFLNYISNVLPDLGVDKVRQYTLEELAFKLIGKNFKISEGNEKLVKIVNSKIDADTDVIIQESKLKSSMIFKDLLGKYLKNIEEQYTPKEDLVIKGVKIITKEEVYNLFINEYQIHSYDRRIYEIKKHIQSALNKKIPAIVEKIAARRNLEIKTEISKLTDENEVYNKRIEIYEKYEELIKELEKGGKKHIEKYFNLGSLLKSPLEYYKNFITMLSPGCDIDEKVLEYLKNNTMSILNKNEISFEDISALLYIKYKIFGISEKISLKHIVIDEAQDYGILLFWVLKKILNSNSLTILGDIAQGVHYYRGVNNWNELIKNVFENIDVGYQKLEKTYRTTQSIMSVANHVIEKLNNKEIVLGVPVSKKGDNVNFIKKDNIDEIIEDIDKRIESYIDKGYNSIAIIGKTDKECENIFKNIKKYRKDVVLIQSKDSEYNAGVLVIPSYLAKGLEFDVVIIANATEENYKETEIDIKLLYVGITRAMNILDIYYVKNITKLLEKYWENI